MTPKIDTKDRILDAAERLFAERGYAGTSLRSIIAAAGVNLAAVHYHFHSKEALLEALVLRRIAPVNAERLSLLDACERMSPAEPPPLERVVEAFLAPTLRIARDPAQADFVKVLGRIFAEGSLFPKIAREHFGPLFRRFEAALARALPRLPSEELRWRMFFAIGVMAHTLRGGEEMSGLTGSAFSASEEVLARLVAFISAGFRAPGPGQVSRSET